MYCYIVHTCISPHFPLSLSVAFPNREGIDAVRGCVEEMKGQLPLRGVAASSRMVSTTTVNLLTLGAHAQRGLQYLVCPSVCVCVCVCVSLSLSLTILALEATKRYRSYTKASVQVAL